MPLSRYLVIFPHPEKPGWSAVFSTRRASLCLLPDQVLAGLRQGRVPERLTEPLLRLGVVVPDLEAERAQVLGFVEEVNRVDPGLTLAVILGFACNFACPYCYEAGVRDRGGQGMTPETTDALAAFVAARLGLDQRQVLVDFYGGETLLYLPAIRCLARALHALCQERGVRFGFHLVTNGSLLTPEVVDELLPLGLSGARVTFDGPPETHDRLRPFRDGRGSFEAILGNLKVVAGRLPVSVGSNTTEATWRCYPRLLDRLAAKGLGPGRLAQVHFAPVNGAGEGVPEAARGCRSANEPWVGEAAVALRDEALRRGYRVAKLAPSPCMIDRTHALAVGPDGALYKCPGLVGRPEFAVGDLRSGVGDYGANHGVEAWRADPGCGACAYLPLCFGGCRFAKLEREGTLAGVDCLKPFLDAALVPMLGQDLRYRHSGGTTGFILTG